jgi:hypothetical protein
MGAEAKCTVTLGRTKTEGKALLETDVLTFRGGDVRLSIPFARISAVVATEGSLRVTHADGVATFALGAAAARWAEKIRNPPTRADKLGVKAGQRVLILGVHDPTLAAEVEARGGELVPRDAAEVDVVFYAAQNRGALAQLPTLQRRLTKAGMLWVVRPRGSAAISEADVMAGGAAAGLVDVKVVRFSDTHTAEKFVRRKTTRS